MVEAIPVQIMNRLQQILCLLSINVAEGRACRFVFISLIADSNHIISHIKPG